MLASQIVGFGRKQARKARALCAFNTCVDAVVSLPKNLHLPRPKLFREVADTRQLLSTLAYYVEKEVGGESAVTSAAVGDWIADSFKTKYRIGGQAGNAAMALAALGAKKIYCHSYPLSELRGKLFDKRVLFPRLDHNGGVKYFPAGKLGFGKDGEISWIFDFGKDRFIASSARFSREMRIDPHFAHSLHSLSRHANTALVAGFHLARKTGDVVRAKEVIEELRRLNPTLPLHLELGDMLSGDVAAYTLKEIAPLCGRVGMNEAELEYFSRRAISSVDDAIGAAEKLAAQAKLERLVVHTREYSLGVVNRKTELTPDRELRALALGNLVARAKAATGKDPTWKDVARVSKGEIEGKTDGNTAVAFVKPVKPKTTLGLGDAFTAGLMVGEL